MRPSLRALQVSACIRSCWAPSSHWRFKGHPLDRFNRAEGFGGLIADVCHHQIRTTRQNLHASAEREAMGARLHQAFKQLLLAHQLPHRHPHRFAQRQIEGCGLWFGSGGNGRIGAGFGRCFGPQLRDRSQLTLQSRQIAADSNTANGQQGYNPDGGHKPAGPLETDRARFGFAVFLAFMQPIALAFLSFGLGCGLGAAELEHRFGGRACLGGLLVGLAAVMLQVPN